MSIHHGCPFGAYIEIPGPLLLRTAPGQQYAVSFTAGAVAFMEGDLI
jgi:hypothetical protein